MHTPAILIVEDHPSVIMALKSTFTHKLPAGVRVDTSGSLGQAGEMLGKFDYDAIVLDLGLPGSSGMATFRAMAKAAEGTPILIYTGSDLSDEEQEEFDAEGVKVAIKGGKSGMASIVEYLKKIVAPSEPLTLTEPQIQAVQEKITEADSIRESFSSVTPTPIPKVPDFYHE